jgi:general secretion pathway protein G
VLHKTGQSGFTLIELLIVVAIIGIVAAIAIPNLMNAVDRTKQKSTMADIKTLGTAIEHYAIDNNCYPMVSDINSLAAELEPLYIPKVPRSDGWGHAFVYEQAATPGDGYTLKSVGKDGSPQASPPGGVTHSFQDDIIYTDGAFVQEPAGRQE